MKPSTDYCVVQTTTNNAIHATELASLLLGARLAACVQLQPITSQYVWKNETRSDDEVLLQIKTRSALFGRVCEMILANHPYETPEIIQLPIAAGLGKYLEWIDEATWD